MGNAIKLWQNYIAGDMMYFYKEINKFTRVELLELADNFEGLFMVLRRQVKSWDGAMNYPAENEE